MVVSSGFFPYQMEGSQPFIVPPIGSGAVGFSGILFEQAQWTALAEWRRYGGIASGNLDAFKFRMYHNISGAPGLGLPYPSIYEVYNERYAFEPNPSGVELCTSGSINATNWIRDLRLALSGLPNDDPTRSTWGLVGLDCDMPLSGVNPVHYSQVWLRALGDKVGRQLSSSGYFNPAGDRHYHHGIYSVVNEPSVSGFLGSSGTLYDIDLREVSYHPITRFSKLSINRMYHVSGPIFPCFAHPNGQLIKTNSFENNFQGSGYIGQDLNYRHVQSGFTRIDGDVLLPTNAIFSFGGVSGHPVVFDKRKFINGTETFQTEDFQVNFRENFPSGETFYPINRCFVVPPSGTDRTFVEVSIGNSGIPVPSSLEVSVFPLRNISINHLGESSQSEELNLYDDFDMVFELPTSGFQYYTDALWTTHPNYVEFYETANKHAGLGLIPPIGSRLFSWIRLDSVPLLDLDDITGEPNSISEADHFKRVGNEIWHLHPPVSPFFGLTTSRLFKRSLTLDTNSRTNIPPAYIPEANGVDLTEVYLGQSPFIYNGECIGAAARNSIIFPDYNILIFRALDGSSTVTPYRISHDDGYSSSSDDIVNIFEVSIGQGLGFGIALTSPGGGDGIAVASGFATFEPTLPTDPLTDGIVFSPPTTNVTDNTGYGFTRIALVTAVNITDAVSFNNGLWAIGGIGRSSPLERGFLGRITIGYSDDVSGFSTNITLEELHPITFSKPFEDAPPAFGSSLLRIGVLET